jgi:hypothetical protein
MGMIIYDALSIRPDKSDYMGLGHLDVNNKLCVVISLINLGPICEINVK